MHETLKAFGYPDTAIVEDRQWAVVFRQSQVTIGSLVLICKDENALSLGDISTDSATVLPTLIKAVENTLISLFSADKFNYLCLMMVDPHVHFHIIPRYSESVTMLGQQFEDKNWPGPPDVTKTFNLGTHEQSSLIRLISEQVRLELSKIDPGNSAWKNLTS